MLFSPALPVHGTAGVISKILGSRPENLKHVRVVLLLDVDVLVDWNHVAAVLLPRDNCFRDRVHVANDLGVVAFGRVDRQFFDFDHRFIWKQGRSILGLHVSQLQRPGLTDDPNSNRLMRRRLDSVISQTLIVSTVMVRHAIDCQRLSLSQVHARLRPDHFGLRKAFGVAGQNKRLTNVILQTFQYQRSHIQI